MTQNSVICNYIAEHTDTWKEDFAELGILVKYEDDYAIFNYAIMCDFYNPIVQEARGIIIDLDKLEVVCWPFRKFGNCHEGYADTIDWNTAQIQEKVDGSILKLWYDYKKNTWRESTNTLITPTDMFKTIIRSAIELSNLDYEVLDKDCTYIFELISPDNQIVIKYDLTKIVHIGVRNNKTGIESKPGYIGIRTPKLYKLEENTLSECIKLAEKLNENATEVKYEGFVVVDKDFHRVKVKSPEYLLWHRQASNHKLNKEDCIELIFSGRDKVEEFITNFPDTENNIRFYQYQIAEFCKVCDRLNLYVKNLYEENNNDKKAVALSISHINKKYTMIAFEYLKTQEKTLDILKKLRFSAVVKIFDTYVEPEVYNIIKGGEAK